MKLNLRFFSLTIKTHTYFFVNPHGSHPELNRPNYHMFVQDVPGRVAPYFSEDNTGGGIGSFAIHGEPDHVEQAKAILSRIAQEREDPEENAERAVRKVAEHMMWTGRLLVDLRNRQQQEWPRYATSQCHSIWVRKAFGFYYQLGIFRNEHAIEIHIGRVPKAYVYEVRIPSGLGGMFQYNRFTKALDRFSSVGPRHWTRRLENNNWNGIDWGFDQKNYRKKVNANRDLVSQAWGWNGRDMSSEFATEYFLVFRNLKLHRACALVREAIVDSINAIFNARGINAKVDMASYKTAGEIDAIINQLHCGELSLEKAYREVAPP
jgi:hypothetical protein